jgi:hypothetical protein
MALWIMTYSITFVIMALSKTTISIIPYSIMTQILMTHF